MDVVVSAPTMVWRKMFDLVDLMLDLLEQIQTWIPWVHIGRFDHRNVK